jgi:hypothetical protein
VTPPRPHDATRRTTSIDVRFPDFDAKTVTVEVGGRDIDNKGVRDELAITMVVDLVTGRVLSSEVDQVVDANLRSGFRRVLAERMPDEAASRTLRYSVLDDAPGCFLVSGYALLRDGLIPRFNEEATAAREGQADVCAGWDVRGPVFTIMREQGVSPTPYGPVAPVLEAADRYGWHPLPELERGTIRRRRVIDVWPGNARGHFRDSYTADDHEMVMHEYSFDVTLDGDRISSLAVVPRVLPWLECPNAIASAQGVVGLSVEDVVEKVRVDYVGTSTCTHLNSTLKSLADISALG